MSESAQSKEQSNIKRRVAVADLLESDRVILNAGTDDGISRGQRYLIYTLSDDEVFDPVTGESLGKVEIPKGIGVIAHAQARTSVLESEKEDTAQGASIKQLWGLSAHVDVQKAPFRSPNIGDRVKRIY